VHLGDYLQLALTSQTTLAGAYRTVAEGHADEPDVEHILELLAAQSDRHAEGLRPFTERYADGSGEPPEQMHIVRFRGEARSGGLGLLRDLQDLYVMASECDITWTMVGQAAQGVRDDDLLAHVNASEGETANQLRWLRTRMKQAAPQALVVA
jgi:hypothetical protein